jgi:uncharacterized paraquat-inducible protein A
MSKEIPCPKCGHVWLWVDWKKPEDAHCPRGYGCSPSAKDRIEVLEAKLAKAVEALALADAALSGANMNMRVVEQKVKATLAELKGQDDE